MTTHISSNTGNILDLDAPPVTNGSTSTEQVHLILFCSNYCFVLIMVHHQQTTVSMFEGLSVTSSSSTAAPTTTGNTDFTSLFGNMSINKVGN